MSPVPVAIAIAIAPGLEHEKSNAITALQEWPPSPEGAMVTIDAMGRPEFLLPAPRGLESLSRRYDRAATSRIREI
jgi:hypothetical protein